MTSPPIRPLALLGGTPCFPEPLHVGRPHPGDPAQLARRIQTILNRNWLTNNGPEVQEFEEQIAETLGVRHCIAVANATVGLELTADALQLTGEVIVPAFTFVATASALVRRGLQPVFCDVDLKTHQLDLAHAESLITNRTSAILAVHLWGTPCDVASLQDLANRYRLRLFFDAAHAFACEHSEGMVGRFGDAEVFSFHATKFIQSAEGGAVTTDDDALAAELRLLRNFGFSKLDTVVRIGTNAKLSELHAAMGLTSLSELSRLLEVNASNYADYQRLLGSLPGLSLLPIPGQLQHNRQYIVVTVDPAVSPLSRDQWIAVLWSENVLARRYFTPGIHRIPAFAEYVDPSVILPGTDQLCQTVLQLPTGASISEREISGIGRILQMGCEQADQIRAKLSSSGGSALPGASK